MLGVRYIKADPTQYIIHFQNGSAKRQGAGLAFFYFRPASSIVVVPMASADVPFIFNEMAEDFQAITVQGLLTYRITDPERVASMLNFTISDAVDNYVTEDPAKLPQRLINLAQVLARAEVLKLLLRETMLLTDTISRSVLQQLTDNETVSGWGVEVLDFAILSIRPTPEISKALEAESREALLRQSDEAIYSRRNAAVEQERRIKENELNTEIAVEEKKRQIRETKVAADLSIETKEQQVRETQLAGKIKLESERKNLVAAQAENERTMAEAESYKVEMALKPLKALDEAVLQVLAMQSPDARLTTAMAFKHLAENASKIGQLNITPDLLQTLMQSNER
ncbi:MAG: SPFH domain-containing protein [Anaerolineales bacterium]|nr:MAG: SPFH domain-containing protein [Anaerolineales bacterium]